MRRVALVFLVLAFGFSVVGCTAGNGLMKYGVTLETFDPPQKDGGPPVLKNRTAYDLEFLLPKMLDQLKKLSMTKDGITLGGMDIFEPAKVNSNIFIYVGLGLLLVGGLLAFYLKQYIAGAVVGGVGLFSLVAPTVLPVISGIVIAALLAAVVLAVVYVIGKYAKGLEVNWDGKERAAELALSPVPGDDRAAAAVLRTTDPGIDAKFKEEKAKRATKPVSVPAPVPPV